MPLTTGSRLGPYEILSLLGAGGMGEVYKARDTRLDRIVAIKILRDTLASDPQFRERFEREARTISQLSHPHICTLYDVGRLDGTDFLVMEYLEGGSLAARLEQGTVPTQQALTMAIEIAGALAAAHRAGVVHRDFKPGNVMLTKAGTKLLDFGIAKHGAGLAGRAGAPGPQDPAYVPTALPTALPALTAEGTILGTFQYMAPEQLEGRDADARSDIWAFGCVLYEMLTGRRAFGGNTQASLIGAIMHADQAPIAASQPLVPRALDHVVRKCLDKDPEGRWQSVHDVAEALRWIGEADSHAGAAAPVTVGRKMRERVAWALATIFAAASLALGATYLRTAPRSAALPFRATLNPPPATALIPYDELGLALSTDGKRLAFVAIGRDGAKQIWIRDFASNAVQPVPETRGAAYPFWSPDDRYLGFFADGKLKKVDLRGGSPQVLADAPSGRGGSWSRDDVILYAPNISSPIHRISASGGTPKPVTNFDPKNEATHRWPHFLPDGKHFLYVVRARLAGKPEVGRLTLASLDSPTATILVEDATNASYVDPGYLVYGRGATLLAQRFDPRALSVTGQPTPVSDEKLSFWEAKNFIVFAASNDGTLVYLPDSARTTVLTWYDRTGRPLGAIGEPGRYGSPRLSPDAKQIAYVLGDSQLGHTDLWLHDLEFNRSSRLTFQSGNYSAPRWSRDGQRLMFYCQPKSVGDLCVKSLREAGDVRLLLEGPHWKGPGGWTPDGSILYDDQSPQTNEDLLLMPGDGKGEPRVLLRTPFNEVNPELSPDGRWVAYLSDQTGRPEVYVRSVTGSPEQWQISTSGGATPRWRADTKELYFTAPDGKVMAVPIETQPLFRPANPKVLFTLPEAPERDQPLFEDVMPDGQKFLLNLPTESRSTVGLHAILNWPSLLKDAK